MEDQTQTLEEIVQTQYTYWKEKVDSLNKLLKKLPDLIDLQTIVYSDRQQCLEYYYSLLNKLADHSKQYKKEYASRYNWYKTQAQIRYASDSAINAQIDADLADYSYNIALLNDLAKYIQETLKTIDNIIYGISNRVKIEELVQSYGK